MRRSLLALALVLGTFVPAAPASAAQPARDHCLNEYRFEMYRVEVQPLKPVYKRGQTITFLISLTQPSDYNPMDRSLPWIPPVFSEPVADADIGVGLMVGPDGRETFLYGLGRTNGQGQARVGVKIPQHVQAGPAHATVLAKKTIVEDPARCLVVVFYGYRQMPNATRVVD